MLFIVLIVSAPQPTGMKWHLFFVTNCELHVTTTVNFAWVTWLLYLLEDEIIPSSDMNLCVISGLFEQVSACKGCHGVCQKNCSWVSQCNSESLAVIKTFTSWPIPHPDLISNCPYCVLCNSYDVVWESLVLDSPNLYFSFFSFLVCLMFYWFERRNSVLVTQGS